MFGLVYLVQRYRAVRLGLVQGAEAVKKVQGRFARLGGLVVLVPGVPEERLDRRPIVGRWIRSERRCRGRGLRAAWEALRRGPKPAAVFFPMAVCNRVGVA